MTVDKPKCVENKYDKACGAPVFEILIALPEKLAANSNFFAFISFLNL